MLPPKKKPPVPKFQIGGETLQSTKSAQQQPPPPQQQLAQTQPKPKCESETQNTQIAQREKHALLMQANALQQKQQEEKQKQIAFALEQQKKLHKELLYMEEEYDPAKPNDYEQVINQRNKMQQLVQYNEAESALHNANIQIQQAQTALKLDAEKLKNTQSNFNYQQQQQFQYAENRTQQLQAPSQSIKDMLKVPQTQYEEEDDMFADFVSPFEQQQVIVQEEQVTQLTLPPQQHELEVKQQEWVTVKPKGSKSMNEKILKMMEKHGWKKGEGMGKHKQGITAPLIAEKKGDSLAVIRQSKIDMQTFQDHQNEDTILRTLFDSLKIKPSKLLLIRNLANKEDIVSDQQADELRMDIAEECLMHGWVTNIVMIVLEHAAQAEAVRIFVEFNSVDHAIKTFMKIKDRIFNGRLIKCTFYNEDLYIRGVYDL